MEDTLWVKSKGLKKGNRSCLNPYSIGRYSLRIINKYNTMANKSFVLILILLEDTLWGGCILHARESLCGVLILILLEDTLWEKVCSVWQTTSYSLNPYSIGRYSLSRSSTTCSCQHWFVLILILLEDTLWVNRKVRFVRIDPLS